MEKQKKFSISNFVSPPFKSHIVGRVIVRVLLHLGTLKEVAATKIIHSGWMKFL